jgi:two-component system, chemotaxis family, protein-glutamate methylesterase/glutaminase
MAIRVLIVDDSSLTRALISDALSGEPDLEVVGEAGDGLTALRLIKEKRPDVVTMDVLMPIMGGAETIARVMAECPTPIVVFAATDSHQPLAFRALELGAAEVFAKPRSGLDAATIQGLAAALRRAATARVGRRPPGNAADLPPRQRSADGVAATVEILGIVGSTGAPQVLQRILAELPARFPWAIAVVQHTLRGFTESLVQWLGSYTPLSVQMARPGMQLLPGKVVVAPDDGHLEIDPSGRAVVQPGPLVDGHRPSATVLLRSLAANYGRRAAGLVLTGMGRDGAAGAAELDAARGLVLVEDPTTAMLPTMPSEALALVPHALRETTARLPRWLVELSQGRRQR